jgi:threonine aldolase
MLLPPPPARSFSSDNAAAIHPVVLDAISRANAGHAVAYGDDPWTRECEEQFRTLFDADVVTLLAFAGTGANVLALGTMLGPVEAVVCAAGAHVAVDEAGAAERILGAKVIELPSPDGKLRPDQLDGVTHLLGSEHHVQPGVVSITQSTELGAVYTPAEVTALCTRAHSAGMRVHMDGARIANAVAALGGTVDLLRAFTIDAGVDVVTFGGTKNGLLGGEAVVYLTTDHARAARFVRKQVTQLPSKMRFVAAQFTALLQDDLWIALAAHSNAMTALLHSLTTDVPGVVHAGPPQVNSLFPHIPHASIAPLREWCFFWPWNVATDQVRWMTAWDTTEEDVAAFADGVRQLVSESAGMR